MKPDFQRLPRIELPESYLENALAKAAKRLSQRSFKGTPIERAQKREVERIIMVRDALLKYVQKMHDGWPSINELPEFYLELINHVLSIDKLKKCLGSLNFAQDTIKKLSTEYMRLIKRQISAEMIKRQMGVYLGRVASVFKRLRKNLLYLEEARNTLRLLPTIDPEAFIVAIAGFPNVGKSTLLGKLTTAKPEIKNYAFTTKGLNVGSFEHKFHKIQLIDTPGTLARTKENAIERLATITRQYAARLVVYVYDLTEPYPLIDQEKLRERIEQEGHDVITYVSKADILPKEEIALFVKKHPGMLTKPADVKKAITQKFSDWI